jgi:murein DD-endopeptidase MepM/ murein hydrolase activator NlpD
MKIKLTEEQYKKLVHLQEIAPPLEGNLHVTSPYGPRWGRQHRGTDYRARTGTPVRSVESGTVRSAGFKNNSCGGTIIVKHDNGYRSSYCHMSKINVNKGDKVEKGDIIGASGGGRGDKGRGNSKASHLHFGLKLNGRWVDPVQHVNKSDLVVSTDRDSFDNTLTDREETSIYLWDGCGKSCRGGNGPQDKEDMVEIMQQNLINNNYILPKFGVDGKFGPETLKAVNAFQKDHNFKVGEEVTREMLKALEDESLVNKNPAINDPTAIKAALRDGLMDNNVENAIRRAAKLNGVSEELMFTIANIESRFNPRAVNRRSGASGLYQILPKYFSSYKVNSNNVFDPFTNANAAGKKLNDKMRHIRQFLSEKGITGRDLYVDTYIAHNQGTTGYKIITWACEQYPTSQPRQALRRAAADLGLKKSVGDHVYSNMKGNSNWKNTPCNFLTGWTDLYATKKLSTIA